MENMRMDESGRKRGRSRSRSPFRNRRRDDDGRGRRANYTVRTPANQRVYISNIPFDMRWQQVKDFFEEKVGGVKFVELFNDERGEARGCGIIEFSSPDAADRAVTKLNRFSLKDRKILVQHDLDCERDACGRIVTKGAPGQARDTFSSHGRDDSSAKGGSVEFQETYGLNEEFLRSLSIDCQLVPSVFVANLPYNVKEEDLKDVFSLAGKVRNVDLSRDRAGSSRGFAVIEYEHPVEAVQAISMLDNQTYYDRRLNVKMDKKAADDLAASNSGSGSLPEGLASIGVGLGINGLPIHTGNMGGVNPGIPAAPAAAPFNLALSQQLLLAQLAAGLGGVQQQQQQQQHQQPMAQQQHISLMQQQQQQHGGLSGYGGGNFPGDMMGGGGVASGVTGSGVNGSVGGNAPGMGQSLRMNELTAMASTRPAMATMGVMSSSSQGQYGSTNRTFSRYEGGGPDGDVESSYSRRTTNDVQSTASYPTPGAAAVAPSPGGAVGGGSRKQYVVFRNLAESVTWEDLRNLASRYGEVDGVEVSGKGTGIVRFRIPKSAERAAADLDRQRFHQREMEVYMY